MCQAHAEVKIQSSIYRNSAGVSEKDEEAGPTVQRETQKCRQVALNLREKKKWRGIYRKRLYLSAWREDD